MSVCRINPEGSRLEEQDRDEELISFLTSLQDFWAAANLSLVKKVMESSWSNVSLERALAMLLFSLLMYCMSLVNSEIYAN